MYNTAKILEAFEPLVGFKATAQIPLSEALTTTTSGLLVNEVHPMLTPKNLKAFAPDEYEADPDAQIRLETFLADTRKAAILQAVSSFMNEKTNRRSGTDILKSRPLYNTNALANNYSQNVKARVGWTIRLKPDESLVSKVRRVSFHGTEAATINLSLLNSYIGEVANIDLVYTNAGKQQWFDLEDWFLKSYDPENNIQGGTWFISYDLEAYAGRPINKGIDWVNFCRGCGRTYERITVDVLKKNGIFAKPSYYLNSAEPFDFADSCNDTFGLNLDVYVGCDYTQFLIDNADIFANYIQISSGIKFLNHFIDNPDNLPTRTSTNAERKIQKLNFDLFGDPDGVTKGLNGQLKDVFSAMHVNTEGLSSICFGESKRGKIRVASR